MMPYAGTSVNWFFRVFSGIFAGRGPRYWVIWRYPGCGWAKKYGLGRVKAVICGLMRVDAG
jgi:hypothetical protein